MAYTYRDMYDTIITSGKYTTRLDKIKGLAQLVFSNDRSQNKKDCAWDALEKYESMTGFYFDPTQEQLDDIIISII